MAYRPRTNYSDRKVAEDSVKSLAGDSRDFYASIGMSEPVRFNPTSEVDIGKEVDPVRSYLGGLAAGRGLESTLIGAERRASGSGSLRSALASQEGRYDPSAARGYERAISQQPIVGLAEQRIAEQSEAQQAQGRLVDFETEMRGTQLDYTNARQDWEQSVNQYNQVLEGLRSRYEALGYEMADAQQAAAIELQGLGVLESIAQKRRAFAEAEQKREQAYRRFQTGISVAGAATRVLPLIGG